MTPPVETWEFADRLRAAVDPRTVQWVGVCRDCGARSDRTMERAVAILWRLGHRRGGRAGTTGCIS